MMFTKELESNEENLYIDDLLIVMIVISYLIYENKYFKR